MVLINKPSPPPLPPGPLMGGVDCRCCRSSSGCPRDCLQDAPFTQGIQLLGSFAQEIPILSYWLARCLFIILPPFINLPPRRGGFSHPKRFFCYYCIPFTIRILIRTPSNSGWRRLRRFQAFLPSTSELGSQYRSEVGVRDSVKASKSLGKRATPRYSLRSDVITKMLPFVQDSRGNRCFCIAESDLSWGILLKL